VKKSVVETKEKKVIKATGRVLL